MSRVTYSLLLVFALLLLCSPSFAQEESQVKKEAESLQNSEEAAQEGAETVDTVHDGEVYKSHEFTGVDFSGHSFVGAKFYAVDFEFANLSNADFTGAKFNGVDFKDVNLEGACFINTKLNGVDFERTNLKGAIFTGARKVGTEFLNSNESEIVWDGPLECPHKEAPDKTVGAEDSEKVTKVYE